LIDGIDLTSEFMSSAATLNAQPVTDIYSYLKAICAPIVAALEHCKFFSNDGRLDEDEPGRTLATIGVDGYLAGYPRSGTIRLFHIDGVFQIPDIAPRPLHMLHAPTVYGSPVLTDKLLLRPDIRFQQYLMTWDIPMTTEEVIRLSRNYIAACADPVAIQMDDFCLSVGGDLHAANVTRDAGFQWVPGFEPVSASEQIAKTGAIPRRATPARQRWNRLFFAAVICWAVFCLFVQPILMAREGQIHFEGDNRFCYENYSATHTELLQGCLDRAKDERAKGMYAGFGVEYDQGHGFSYPWYFRVMRWFLLFEVIAPPILLYGLVWGAVSVSLWIWRGSEKNRVTHLQHNTRK
jgi:hypothetical protein